jgi:preprotein translocase subunit SecF
MVTTTSQTNADRPAARPPAKPATWFMRLYTGDAGVPIVGRRRLFFGIAAAALLAAIVGFGVRGFTLGIDFRGGDEFQIPATVGTLTDTQSAVGRAIAATEPGATVVSAQRLGGSNPAYLVTTSPLTPADTATVKSALAGEFHIAPQQISDNRVSAAWGSQVTRQALIGLAIFLVLVIGYLILRFEWRMAVAAVSSLAFDLVVTAAVYSIVGFEITPSTIIGFLTILGFALYDVVVVFDKIQENTKGITTRTNQTYAEAANLAVNQTLMRSINTGLVALLPVGGLLFIGAGLLGAGTLKDLGLVLFVGMGTAVYSSIFFATPVLVTLKRRQPELRAHAGRVLAARRRDAAAGRGAARRTQAVEATPAVEPTEPAAAMATAGAAAPAPKPRPGTRPAAAQGRGGRPHGQRNGSRGRRR